MTTTRPPSPAVEDYAKAIYALTITAGHASASTTALAERLHVTAGSVSAMLKRMHARDLVVHRPYHGTTLTTKGEHLALRVIRRHRLLELFLATSLDLSWDDVHHHAETLEHAAADELIEAIAVRLGHPTTDPHGHPIPTQTLEIEENATLALSELNPGERATHRAGIRRRCRDAAVHRRQRPRDRK